MQLFLFFILFCFCFFSLFLKGEELFLPIYSLCVCVNTFILNLKLIKYHLSQMSPDVGCFFLMYPKISQNGMFFAFELIRLTKS